MCVLLATVPVNTHNTHMSIAISICTPPFCQNAIGLNIGLFYFYFIVCEAEDYPSKAIQSSLEKLPSPSKHGSRATACTWPGTGNVQATGSRCGGLPFLPECANGGQEGFNPLKLGGYLVWTASHWGPTFMLHPCHTCIYVISAGHVGFLFFLALDREKGAIHLEFSLGTKEPES